MYVRVCLECANFKESTIIYYPYLAIPKPLKALTKKTKTHHLQSASFPSSSWKNSQLPFRLRNQICFCISPHGFMGIQQGHAREISCKRNQPWNPWVHGKARKLRYFCGIMHGAQGEKTMRPKFESWWIAVLFHLLYVTFKVAISWKALGCQESYFCCILVQICVFFGGEGVIVFPDNLHTDLTLWSWPCHFTLPCSVNLTVAPPVQRSSG